MSTDRWLPRAVPRAGPSDETQGSEPQADARTPAGGDQTGCGIRRPRGSGRRRRSPTGSRIPSPRPASGPWGRPDDGARGFVEPSRCAPVPGSSSVSRCRVVDERTASQRIPGRCTGGALQSGSPSPDIPHCRHDAAFGAERTGEARRNALVQEQAHVLGRSRSTQGRPADASHGLPDGCVPSGWGLANMPAARNASRLLEHTATTERTRSAPVGSDAWAVKEQHNQ